MVDKQVPQLFTPPNMNEFEKRFQLDMRKERDPYTCNIGKAVELETQLGRHYGIYSGLTREGDIVLYPYVETKVYFIDPNAAEIQLKRRKHEWKDERPLIIRVPHFVMNPTSRDEIDERLGIHNSYFQI